MDTTKPDTNQSRKAAWELIKAPAPGFVESGPGAIALAICAIAMALVYIGDCLAKLKVQR